MSDYQMRIHMDDRSVGHGYIEMIRKEENGESNSTFFGFYPDGTFNYGDNGIVKVDQDRHLQNLAEPESVNLHTTPYIDLTEEEHTRAIDEIAKWVRDAPDYDFERNNCIDFVQTVYSTAKGEEAGDFTSYYTEQQLEQLDWAGRYADTFYDNKEEADENKDSFGTIPTEEHELPYQLEPQLFSSPESVDQSHWLFDQTGRGQSFPPNDQELPPFTPMPMNNPDIEELNPFEINSNPQPELDDETFGYIRDLYGDSFAQGLNEQGVLVIESNEQDHLYGSEDGDQVSSSDVLPLTGLPTEENEIIDDSFYVDPITYETAQTDDLLVQSSVTPNEPPLDVAESSRTSSGEANLQDEPVIDDFILDPEPIYEETIVTPIPQVDLVPSPLEPEPYDPADDIQLDASMYDTE